MANQFRVKKGLVVNGSGSTILDVQGSQGQLFSVTDQLSGSLFAVKDISGIPVIEAFSDNRVNIGTFNAEAIKVSGSYAFVTGSLSGSFFGSLTTSLTAGSVPFVGSAGILTQNNSNLFWDSSNLRLGVGTNSPAYKLDVSGDIRLTGILYVNSINSGLNFSVGTGVCNIFNNTGTAGNTRFTFGGSTYFNVNQVAGSASGNTSGTYNTVTVPVTYAWSSGTAVSNQFVLNPTINNTGTYSGTFRGLYYNPTLTSLTGTTHISLETVSGDVLLGTTSGRVAIGTSTDTGHKLLVSGSGASGSLNVDNTLYVSGSNVGMGVTASASYKLDVAGSTRIKGIGATNSTNAFQVINSNNDVNFITYDNLTSTFLGPGKDVSGVYIGKDVSLSWTNSYGSVVIGNSANVAGNAINQVVIGKQAYGAASRNVIIGSQAGSNGGSNFDAIFIGYLAGNHGSLSYPSAPICIGPQTSAGSYSISIGDQASSLSYGIAMGQYSKNLGTGVYGAAQNGQVALGYSSSAQTNGANPNNGSIAIGGGSAAGETQFVAGSPTSLINNVYFGSGVQRNSTTGSGASYTVNGSGASGTDFAGGDITIAGGKGTGTGSAGNVVFSTSTTGSTGSTLQTLSERMRVVGGSGNVLIGTTTDSGYKLDVNGTSRLNGNVSFGISSTFDFGIGLSGGELQIKSRFPSAQGNINGLRIIGGNGSVSNSNSLFATSIANNTIAANILHWSGQGILISYNDANGTVNNASSILELKSTTKGILIPRMTAAQRTSISAPTQGLQVYDTGSATEGIWYYNSGSFKSWTRVLNDSGSQVISGSLTIVGSGSASPLMTVIGSQGELFSVNDTLSGSLFSVNDISGLPVLEAFSDNRVLMGSYQAPALYTTVKVNSVAGNNVIYQNLPTGSYDGIFVDYAARSGSNGRVGQLTGIWSASAVLFTEFATSSFGDSTGLAFTVIVTGSNMAVTASTSTENWSIKTIIRSV